MLSKFKAIVESQTKLFALDLRAFRNFSNCILITWNRKLILYQIMSPILLIYYFRRLNVTIFFALKVWKSQVHQRIKRSPWVHNPWWLQLLRQWRLPRMPVISIRFDRWMFIRRNLQMQIARDWWTPHRFVQIQCRGAPTQCPPTLLHRFNCHEISSWITCGNNSNITQVILRRLIYHQNVKPRLCKCNRWKNPLQPMDYHG